MADYLPPLELKFDATRGELTGYASRFGVRDYQGDTVQRGAFATSLNRLKAAGRSVPMLWSHDPSVPIGVWSSSEEDAVGLKVRGQIVTETTKGRDAFALVKARAATGLSIGYRVVKSRPDGRHGRLLDELDLAEISVVAFPALDTARIDAVKTQTTITRRLLTKHLTEMPGMTTRLAQKILANVDWSALNAEDDTDTKSRLADALRRHIENFNKG